MFLGAQVSGNFVILRRTVPPKTKKFSLFYLVIMEQNGGFFVSLHQ